MNFKRDLERTATGYVWLDKLTDPYWKIASWRQERKYWKMFARKGENWKDARERLRPILLRVLEEEGIDVP